jgi:hypothetical protein
MTHSKSTKYTEDTSKVQDTRFLQRYAVRLKPLGVFTLSTCKQLPMFRKAAVSSYVSSSCPKAQLLFVDYWNVLMKALRSLEMRVTVHQSIWRNVVSTVSCNLRNRSPQFTVQTKFIPLITSCSFLICFSELVPCSFMHTTLEFGA